MRLNLTRMPQRVATLKLGGIRVVRIVMRQSYFFKVCSYLVLQVNLSSMTVSPKPSRGVPRLFWALGTPYFGKKRYKPK